MKMLTFAKYSQEALRGMVENPTSRTAAVSAVLENAGLKVHSIDFCIGDWDVVLIAEADSWDKYTGVILTVVSSGAIEDWKTYPLISDEEFTGGMKIANTLTGAYERPKS